jgi:predicted PurR-regulated permease PerM
MTSLRAGSRSERALVVLTATVVSVSAITLLFWAQSIFIPLALAAFLTFLLSPLVSSLRRLGIGRTPAVVATVFSAAVGLGLAGWLVTTQLSGLLDELPSYSKNVTKKVKTLKAMTLGSGRLGKMISEINAELGGQPERQPPEDRSGEEPKALATPVPPAVVIEPQTSVWLGRMTWFLTAILEYLGELALALVLAVFMLQKREELRNRVISLIGDGRIAVATKFVDEAGQKISRFLLMQAIVNGTFGVLLSAGLLVIGVKYALVWGFLAAMLRGTPAGLP